ncbi:MAG: hypothetical protein OXC17_10445 [Aestuariivita sp.]|nr:hypothetical protein [Aestuariivita sp.]
MTNKDRFFRMQADRQKRIPSIADSDLVEEFLKEEPDASFVRDSVGPTEYPEFNFDITISDADAIEYLRELRGQFHAERAEVILKEVKADVTRSIVGPLGLGKILAAYDKTGGYVDTVHNVREWKREEKKGEDSKFYKDDGIISEEFKQAYDNRGKYDSEKNHNPSPKTNYGKKREKIKQQADKNRKDTYTGKLLGKKEFDLDHKISAKETHDDAGRVLAELTTEELADLPENLGPTYRTINQSKGAGSIIAAKGRAPEKIRACKKKIASLKNKSDLSPKEKNDLEKAKSDLKHWKALNDTPDRDLLEIEQKAKKAQNKNINLKYYTSKKFAKNTATAAGLEGAKMGLQQAVGLIVIEFLAASFDETKRMIASGTTDWSKLKAALRRIKDRLVDKWQNVLSAFAAGSLSGFLSSLVTTLINAFVTTSKRIVRMIREGFFSFLKAIKTALFPPEGQSYAESFHAASKLLVSGGIIIGGIALEDIIDKALTVSFPVLALLVTPLVLGLVAGLSALLVAFCCYLLDKMDLFGAVTQEEDRFVLDKLDAKIKAEDERFRALIGG